MPSFKQWKTAFDQWENASAEYSEKVMKMPSVLVPAGRVLTGIMKAKAVSDRMQAQWWSAWGLPTKRDQERTLHLLHQLESKIRDLEEKLEDSQRQARN
ncbi:MAG: hypothetical protein K1X94_06520 [Sandaracinaceae bacterium]|nr:hypothetical protein [Sandaracinaceae bacterium]